MYSLRIIENETETLIRCRTWLGALQNTNSEYRNNQKHLAQGTCTWILETKEYLEFSETQEQKHLWVNGIPGMSTCPDQNLKCSTSNNMLTYLATVGSGKSVLSSFVITQTQDHPVTDLRVLFFFCKDSSQETSTAAAIASNLIDQLIGQNPLKSLFKILNNARIIHAKSDKCTDFETLWDIFVSMARKFPTRIMVVVDALDECQTDRSALMDRILSSNEETGGNIRFFLTSRWERDIYDKFTSHNNIIPCLMSVDADIEKFVVQRVEEFQHLQESHLKRRITNEVPKKSAGMFRYATLLLHELDSPSTTDITDLLNAPPKDLNEMYVRILLRLDLAYPNSRSRQMRKKILSWVAVAKRPLSVKELAYACAVKDNETSFDPTKRVLATGRYLLDNCGPLIEILDDKVQYTHLSVKEFLLQKQYGFTRMQKQAEECLLDEGEAHASVGITCSEYHILRADF